MDEEERRQAEACQRCGEQDDDLRTLWMSCWYAMEELGLPFEQARAWTRPEGSATALLLYALTVCKTCRSDWLHAIADWYRTPRVPDPPGADIPIRDLGATRMITADEYARRYPGPSPQGTPAHRLTEEET